MKFFILDHTGHSTIEFTESQKLESAKLFNELVNERKHTAATRSAGQTDYTVIKNSSQIQDETTFIPQMVGG